MNGNSVALDTNQAIAVLNGTADAREWVQSFEHVYLPVPVVGELRFGAMNSKRVQDNLERVGQIITRCTILNVDLETTEAYARTRLQLKVNGTPIPENDVWIAAVCLQHKIRLATSDEHFSSVEGLEIIKK